MKAENRRLIRYLQGTSQDEERRLFEEEMERDARLAERYRDVSVLWQQLEGPPSKPLANEASQKIVSAARDIASRRAETMRSLSWSQAPPWARLGAAAALVLGLTLGSVASARDQLPMIVEESPVEDLIFVTPSLADSYWDLLDDPTWLDSEHPDSEGESR